MSAPASAPLVPLEVPAWVDREAFDFDVSGLALPAGRVAFVDEGAERGQPPVVLVHGTPTWSFDYRHLIRALRDERRVIAFDHLGFGLSDRPVDFEYTPEAHAQVFAQVVAALGLERFDLVVHDFGGPIALDYALAHPERVRRLVVMNSFCWSPEVDPPLARAGRLLGGGVGRFLYRRLNLSLKTILPAAFGDKRKLTRALHAQYLAPFPDADSRGRVLWPLARSFASSWPFFASLWERRAALADTPLLLAWGMRDAAFKPDALARWQEGFSHAQVARFDDAGHWPHEEAADEVTEVIGRFLGAK
jgi:haloalkane dehalogenase